MRSVLTVTTPATSARLTTLARLKQELDISGSAHDVLLAAKLDEASSDIEAALGYRLARESVIETFWPVGGDMALEYLMLDRTPVASIDSVTRDAAAVDASLWRVDPDTGQIYAVDASGYPCGWLIRQSLAIAYTGGWILPGETGRNLPAGIEGAAIELVADYWAATGRDPSVRSETIPGVISTDYWVGAIGEEGELPPRVQMKLAPFRRASV
jgi:hypothetical protein